METKTLPKRQEEDTFVGREENFSGLFNVPTLDTNNNAHANRRAHMPYNGDEGDDPILSLAVT